MSIFEAESWFVAEGKQEKHDRLMRQWFQWVNDHRELFKEWISVRYFVKDVAGRDSGRHILVWEYENLAAFETYKKRRGDYKGPYEEYKKNDPYYTDVFDHSSMSVEFWKGIDRDLWIV
ncbi:MAG: hypothetical protein GY863_10340 [bacterium]|nr:hypothetical protein [bacterium]